MDLSLKKQPKLKSFIMANYDMCENRKHLSKKVTKCPYGMDNSSGDDNICKIVLHGYRDRVTGPKNSLSVAYCRTHKLYFTIYPTGYTPYARDILPLVATDVENNTETIFKAASDASKGKKWDSSEIRYTKSLNTVSTTLDTNKKEDIRCFKTQKRHILKIFNLFYVSLIMDKNLSPEKIYQEYGIRYTLLKEIIHQIEDKTRDNTYINNAKNVMSLIALITKDILLILLELGTKAKIFGKCYFLSEKIATLKYG